MTRFNSYKLQLDLSFRKFSWILKFDLNRDIFYIDSSVLAWVDINKRHFRRASGKRQLDDVDYQPH